MKNKNTQLEDLTNKVNGIRQEQVRQNSQDETLEDGENNRDKVIEKDNAVERPSGIGTRHRFAMLACFILFNIYALSTNLGLTMVSMVTKSAPFQDCKNKSDCHKSKNTTFVIEKKDGQFDWDEKTQGILLGSYYYGYVLTPIAGGRMAEVFGPKIVIGFAILMSSACTLVTPISAELHIGVLLAVRVILGLSQGGSLSSMHFMIGKWIPRSETTTASVFIYGGLILGIIVSMVISGVLCSSEIFGGWPSVYYVFGTLGCIATAFWFIFVYNSPAVHPTISERERKYIECSVGIKKKKQNIPYKSMMTSTAFLAICVSHASYGWGYNTILTCLPTYFNSIQALDVAQSGFLMSIMYVSCWFVALLSGVISDLILRKKWLSTSRTRKLFQSLGSFFGAICLILANLAGFNQVAAITLIILSAALVTFCESGHNVNHIDIAPNFAGTMYGITNTLASVAGIIGPYIVGVLTQNNQTMEQWQIIFYITAGFYCFGGIVFLIFSEGTVQKWND